MKRLKYFMQCYFNQSFGFDELDERIDDFKQESITIQDELINEIKLIIEKKNYSYLFRFMQTHCDIEFDDLRQTEKFINYLYDKLLDKHTDVKATDFIKQYKVIDCPICMQDSKLAELPKIIYKANLVGKDIEIYLCKLCENGWLDENDIRADNAVPYKDLMKAHGLKGWWKELKSVDFL